MTRLYATFELLSIALSLCALLPTPVTASADLDIRGSSDFVARRHHHADIARSAKKSKSKRGNSRRCKSNSSSSIASQSQSSPSSWAEPTSTSSSDESSWTSSADAATWNQNANVVATASTTTDAPAQTGDGGNDNGNDDGSDSASATTSASSSAVATTTPSSSSSGVTKAGNAWANGDSVDMSNWVATGGTPWYYTWNGSPVEGADALGFEYVPQLWGWDLVNQWEGLISKVSSLRTTSSSGQKYLLGCNEPNEAGQSNMDYSSGVSLWKTYMEPFAAQGYQLGSCSTSSNPNGLVWVQNFFKECGSDCTVHFVPIHWYDVSLDGFKTYVQQWHDAFNLPIWVTEWACQNFNNEGDQCSQEEVESFFKQSVQWLDQQDYVHRYAWFGEMHDMAGVNTLNRLMNDDGTPNDLGKWYLGDHSSL